MASPPAYALFDTGPLLCIAACADGPKLAESMFTGRAGMVTDIEIELRGLTRHQHPKTAAAATRALAKFHWIARHDIDDPAELQRIEELQIRLRAFKRRPSVSGPPTREDWGECATITLAERLRSGGAVVLIANDSPARALAGSLQIGSVSFVDFLKVLVQRKKKSSKEAFAMYRAVVDAGLDPGDVVTSHDELR